ncbi:hypothetical protein NXV33_17215 [Bacteroides thetaiotaomicron]|nr:hypothetical protein [Bacteroides thetaiotaomicron]
MPRCWHDRAIAVAQAVPTAWHKIRATMSGKGIRSPETFNPLEWTILYHTCTFLLTHFRQSSYLCVQ